ncbi:MAG: SRPBCC domain-containing protein [Pseudomonadales bacterium]|nr:SRPBCC domain-containing protein [Pseudomonadales bacterium]
MINENTVFSDTVTIQAPITFVWKILVNFEDYDKWNTFCPSLINHALEVGESVDMQVDLGNGLQQQVETLEIIDAPNTLAWGMVMESPEKLKARRTQTLKALDETSCTYSSDDAFSGELTAMIIEHMGPAIETGFNLCAHGLKKYAEALYVQKNQT